MTEEQMIEIIHSRVKEKLTKDSTGHDYYHVVKVANLAKHFAEAEGANIRVCFIAGLLHDYCHPEEKKTGIPHWGPEALKRIGKVLQEAEMIEEEKRLVLQCIAEHECYQFLGQQIPDTLESKILQDADRIEALGATGIARTFMYAGAYGNPMYTPNETLGNWNPEPKIKQSAITHFYEKLLKLYDEIHTESGKKIAAQRTDFMKEFLEQFKNEWEWNSTLR